MKTLYLLRHAKAEPGGATLHDEDRPLAARGREASAAIGAYMRARAYIPQLTLCSSAARTRETMERVVAAHGGEFAYRLEPKLYLATPGEMLAQIQSVEDALNSLLVIGHNPGMHHLAALLADTQDTPLREKLELKFPTGALVVLRFKKNSWKALSPGDGELADFIFPNDLGRMS